MVTNLFKPPVRVTQDIDMIGSIDCFVDQMFAFLKQAFEVDFFSWFGGHLTTSDDH